MARAGYAAQVWEDGVSPVNAERLNEMERGIALGVNLAQEALDKVGESSDGEQSPTMLFVFLSEPLENISSSTEIRIWPEDQDSFVTEAAENWKPIMLQWEYMSADEIPVHKHKLVTDVIRFSDGVGISWADSIDNAEKAECIYIPYADSGNIEYWPGNAN